MAPRGSWKPRLPRTELAEKYGYFDVPIIQDARPLKSSLTPITSKPHSTDSENLFADEGRWIQRIFYCNFTAAELERLDTVAPLYHTYEDETAVPSADVTIHPIMRRKKWNFPLPEHLADFPLGGDLDGDWNAYTNDIVWEAILPSIQIASLYISNADMWPWFDALLEGEWTDIPEEEVPLMLLETKEGWKRFDTRDSLVYGNEAGRRNIQNKIVNFSENIYFRLGSGYVDPACGVNLVDVETASSSGQTLTTATENIALITINFHRLAALLPGTVGKLNIAERRLIQVDFAKTIIHEIGHALYRQECTVRSYEMGIKREPFFQREVYSEIGMSLEQNMFGGITRPIRGIDVAEKDNLSQLEGGAFVYDINTRWAGIESNGNHPILLKKPPNHDTCTFWPVPMPWYLNMGSKNRFELSVKKYGPHTAEYTRIVGSEYYIYRNGNMTQPKRGSFIEFEKIPNNNQHRLGVDRLDNTEPLRKRRRVQHDIGQKVRTFREPQRNEEEMSQIDKYTGSLDFRDHDLPPCNRFDEISNYLITNRRQLALHTMCFAIPEHTLRGYIQRLGGLTISAQEWRAYLLNCDAVPYLFRFQPQGKPGDTSTYRGSIQLHASSWPRTDLTPLSPRRAKPDESRTRNFLLSLHELWKPQPQALDDMWQHSIFWDFSAEQCLHIYNSDVKRGDGGKTGKLKLGVGLMSKGELDDIMFHLASTSSLFTWAPKGILRRLPLTAPEFLEILNGNSTYDDFILPKGRNLIDWDADFNTLCEWDNENMETDLETLDRVNGIKWTDGRRETAREYKDRINPPPKEPLTKEEAIEVEKMKQVEDLGDTVDAYRAEHPAAEQDAIFENAFWPLWSMNNSGKTKEEGKKEFVDMFGDSNEAEWGKVGASTFDLGKAVQGKDCPTQ